MLEYAHLSVCVRAPVRRLLWCEGGWAGLAFVVHTRQGVGGGTAERAVFQTGSDTARGVGERARRWAGVLGVFHCGGATLLF